MSLELAAIDAVKYVRRELPLGARNIDGADARAEEAVEYSRVYAEKIDDGTVGTRIAVAKRFGAGNCQEMAYLAYEFLRLTRPNDGICLITVDLHMAVAARLTDQAVDVRFNLANVADTVIFIDPWIAAWVKGEDGDDAAAADMTGVYARDAYCDLVTRLGERPSRSVVVKTTRADRPVVAD